VTDAIIRIHVRGPEGVIEQTGEDFEPEDFGGFLPGIGDLILAPGAAAGADRSEPSTRTMLKVVGRVFGAADNLNGIALIVEERTVTPEEQALLP
jgi:hypothetical protein